MDEPPADSARRLAAWSPLRTLTDLTRTIADTWRIAGENHELLAEMRTLMADVSNVLNQVADGIRGPLFTSIQELIASEATARADAAAARGETDVLRAEDAGESSAAQNVRAAFNQVAASLSGVPEVPDVTPIPDGGGEPTSPDGPAPVDPTQPGDEVPPQA